MELVNILQCRYIRQSGLQMGPPINTAADLTAAWQTLRLAHPGLPSQLRDPQRDALFWLTRGKSIILCIGTGDYSTDGSNASWYSALHQVVANHSLPWPTPWCATPVSCSWRLNNHHCINRGGFSRHPASSCNTAAAAAGKHSKKNGASCPLVKVCEAWDIPHLSLDEVDPETIFAVIEAMDRKPRVILSTITRVSEEAVQRQLRKLPVKTIFIDEVQVILVLVSLAWPRGSQVMHSDQNIGWSGFLPYWYSFGP